MSFDADGFARRVRSLRASKQLGSARLDALAGVGRGTVSRIESGQRGQVALFIAVKIAAALGVDLNHLVTGAAARARARTVSKRKRRGMSMTIEEQMKEHSVRLSDVAVETLPPGVGFIIVLADVATGHTTCGSNLAKKKTIELVEDLVAELRRSFV